ncbi:MAG: glycosyl transferase, partial [Planctomycetota bacterium]
PRLVRKAGHKTDLFDGTDLCSVRMYRGLGETWRGFAKNAYEGLGSPIVLVVFTLMHVLGHLVPPAVLIAAALGAEIDRVPIALAGAAVVLALIERLILARRMRTSVVGALLHPVGVLLMTTIQWHSLYLHVTGKRSWRGRTAGEA